MGILTAGQAQDLYTEAELPLSPTMNLKLSDYVLKRVQMIVEMYHLIERWHEEHLVLVQLKELDSFFR